MLRGMTKGTIALIVSASTLALLGFLIGLAAAGSGVLGIGLALGLGFGFALLGVVLYEAQAWSYSFWRRRVRVAESTTHVTSEHLRPRWLFRLLRRSGGL